MNRLENDIKVECMKYMHREALNDDFEIGVIYYDPQNPKDMFAYLGGRNEPDEIRMIKPNTEDAPNYLPDWDFNSDTYDFENLQDGYKIAYMSMSYHYGIWCTLEQWMPDEIENKEGMQKYFAYCKENGVTKQAIEYAVGLELNEDALQYHVEINQGYTIVAEININNETIVLAENRTAPSPYVTWKTTPTREYGYMKGHYFAGEENAKKDFYKRASNEVHDTIRNELNISTKNEKGEER